MKLFRNESSDPKSNAQRNLTGLTHYVDDDTLRYHKSRVISSRCTSQGLLFAVVTSDSLDPNNTRRGFRYAIFDIFGHVLERPTLEQAFRTSAQAAKAMYAAIDGMDPKALTAAAIEREQRNFAAEIETLQASIAKLEE